MCSARDELSKDDSGLTTAEFAAELGTNPKALIYWATGEKREVPEGSRSGLDAGSQLGWATFAESRQAPSELNNLGVITTLTSGAELGQQLRAFLSDLLDEQEKGLNSRVDVLVAA